VDNEMAVRAEAAADTSAAAAQVEKLTAELEGLAEFKRMQVMALSQGPGVQPGDIGDRGTVSRAQRRRSCVAVTTPRVPLRCCAALVPS